MAALSSVWGKDVYVSSSSGSDTNDGSIKSPLRSIAAAPKKDASVFLKRGDVFFEAVLGFENCTFDAYGDGAKPLVCGLKIVRSEDSWIRLPNDIWRIDLLKHKDFDGKFADGKTNNIGAVYDIKRDKIYGHLVKRYNDLNALGDFWVAGSVEAVNVQDKGETFQYLYFKSKENPSKDANIAFVTSGFGVREVRNCTVKNIAIKGFGIHGICMAWNCVFDNIDIDLIGGSVQLSYKHWVRLGNGVEFWITAGKECNDNTVKNCKISRTYDCGTTIQGISKKSTKAVNIKFVNNTFYRCRQAFEHFIRSTDGTTGYENCEFSGNRAFEMGENEYSTPETRDADLLSYESNPIEGGLLLKDNVFWGASVYFAYNSYTAKMLNNTFYVFKDQYLFFTRRYPEKVIWAKTDADIAKFKETFGKDAGNIILVDRNDKQARQNFIEKYFSAHREAIKAKAEEPYRRDFFYRK